MLWEKNDKIVSWRYKNCRAITACAVPRLQMKATAKNTPVLNRKIAGSIQLGISDKANDLPRFLQADAGCKLIATVTVHLIKVVDAFFRRVAALATRLGIVVKKSSRLASARAGGNEQHMGGGNGRNRRG